MKVLLQRVLKAKVTSEGKEPQSIGFGLLIFLGVGTNDTEETADKLVKKIVKLRMFDGEKSKFDQSLIDVKGEALVISQFTLFADTSHGRRPSFFDAAKPDQAKSLFEYFCSHLAEVSPFAVKHGEFGARMIVNAENQGPFSIPIDEI